MLFRQLKEKTKEYFTDRDYESVILNMLCSMFEYNGVYEGFYKPKVEMSLLACGKVATLKKGNKLITVPIFPRDLPNENGQYVNYIGHDDIGNVYEHITIDNAAIGFNNTLGIPDMNIERYVELLTDIDISLKAGIRNSRNNPIPTAKDSKTKTALDEIIKLQDVGKTGVVLDSNVLSELVDGSKSIDIINLSDPTTADKLQYLSKLHDDLIRRLATVYGHDFNGSPKSAQQSVEEIKGSESFSWILPYDMLKSRQEWIKQINDKFGYNMTVKFSPTWEVQFNKFKQLDDKDDIKGDDADDNQSK